MVLSGVIEKFVVRVNPAAFGYRTALVLVKTSHGIARDDVIQRVKEFADLAYHVHHMGSTSVAALIIKKPLDDNFIQSLNERLKPATVINIVVTELSVAYNDLSETDLRIIKCLLLFSFQCSPAAMIEYIQFVIPITVAKFHYHNVLERMYSKFDADILYSPSVIEPEDRLTIVLFGENVFVVDYFLARVNSFAGVNSADAC